MPGKCLNRATWCCTKASVGLFQPAGAASHCTLSVAPSRQPLPGLMGHDDQYRQRGPNDTCRNRGHTAKPRHAGAGPGGFGAGHAVGLCDLRGAGRSDADRADPFGRRHAAPHQRAHRLPAARHHRPRGLDGGAGAPARPGGRAAPRPHRRAVCGDRRGARHSGRRGRERHARPRPRPAVLDPHQGDHRELADRRRRLSAGAGPHDPRRHHGDVVRRGARQAAVRQRARALQAVLLGAGEGARACRRGHHRPRRHGDRARRRQHRSADPAAGSRRPCQGQRDRAADRHAARRQCGRRRRQAARLRQRLSQHRPAARSAGGCAIARDASDRQRFRQSADRAAPACSSPSR